MGFWETRKKCPHCKNLLTNQGIKEHQDHYKKWGECPRFGEW